MPDISLNPQNLYEVLGVLSKIRSHLLWLSLYEFKHDHNGRHPEDYRVPVREELQWHGRKEKGCVLNDPAHRYRSYYIDVNAGLVPKETIGAMERQRRAGQMLDHTKALLTVAKRPTPDLSTDDLQNEKKALEDMVVAARTGGTQALRPSEMAGVSIAAESSRASPSGQVVSAAQLHSGWEPGSSGSGSSGFQVRETLYQPFMP